jgi:hypothetical protein
MGWLWWRARPDPWDALFCHPDAAFGFDAHWSAPTAVLADPEEHQDGASIASIIDRSREDHDYSTQPTAS